MHGLVLQDCKIKYSSLLEKNKFTSSKELNTLLRLMGMDYMPTARQHEWILITRGSMLSVHKSKILQNLPITSGHHISWN